MRRKWYWSYLYYFLFSHRSFFFAIAIAVFNLLASFFVSVVHLFLAFSCYLLQNGCHSFSLLKAIAKSKGKLIAISFRAKKSDNYIWNNQETKQRTNKRYAIKKISAITSQEAKKKIPYCYHNIEKKIIISDSTKIISPFGCTNIIFVDFILWSSRN